MLTEQQKEGCSRLIHHALIDIRQMLWNAKDNFELMQATAQAACLADIFHELPREIYGDRRAEDIFERLASELVAHDQRYYGPKDRGWINCLYEYFDTTK